MALAKSDGFSEKRLLLYESRRPAHVAVRRRAERRYGLRFGWRGFSERWALRELVVMAR